MKIYNIQIAITHMGYEDKKQKSAYKYYNLSVNSN